MFCKGWKNAINPQYLGWKNATLVKYWNLIEEKYLKTHHHRDYIRAEIILLFGKKMELVLLF